MARDKTGTIVGLLRDLQKAFDIGLVGYDILLYKFEKYGIRIIAKNWISSYLKERKQVLVAEVKIQWRPDHLDYMGLVQSD